MQYLSDDVIVTGGDQTILSYRTVFTSLFVADMTWMELAVFALGTSKLDFEVSVVSLVHLGFPPLARSSTCLGSPSSCMSQALDLFLLVPDTGSLGAVLLCRSFGHIDSITLAFGFHHLGSAATILDFSCIDFPFFLQNCAQTETSVLVLSRSHTNSVSTLDFTALGVIPLIQRFVQSGSSFFVPRKCIAESLLFISDCANLASSLSSKNCLDSFVFVLGRIHSGLLPSCGDMTLDSPSLLQSVSRAGSSSLPFATGRMDMPISVFDSVQSDNPVSLGLKRPFGALLSVGGLSHLALLMLLHAFQCSDSMLSCVRAVTMGEMGATEIRLGPMMFASGFAKINASLLILEHLRVDSSLSLRSTGWLGLPCSVLDSSQLELAAFVQRFSHLEFPATLLGGSRTASFLSLLSLAHCEATMPVQATVCLEAPPPVVDPASPGFTFFLRGTSWPGVFLPASSFSSTAAFMLLQGII